VNIKFTKRLKYKLPRDIPNVRSWDPQSIFLDRDFLLLWFSQITTLIGGGIFALVVAFLADTGGLPKGHGISSSSSAMGIVILLNNFPSFFVAFIAGVMADWFDRKKIMIISNVLRMLLLVIFLVFHGWEFTFFAFGIIFFISAAKQFFLPAEASIIPDIVARKNIMPANSIFNLTTYVTYVLGFILAGPLLDLMGPDKLILFLILLFILATIATLFIRVPKPVEKRDVSLFRFVKLVQDFIESFISGLQYIFRDKVQKVMMVHNLVAQSFLYIFIALVFKLGEFLIGLTPSNVGFASVMPMGVGIIIGVLILNTRFKYSKRVKLSLFGVLAIFIASVTLSIASLLKWHSIGLLGYSVHTVVVILTGVSVITIGLGFPFLLIPSQTVIQEKTEQGFLGRVYGVWLALSQALASVPAVIIGYTADFLLGVPTTLVWSSIIIGTYAIVLSRYKNLV